jgi:hypothetical protein
MWAVMAMSKAARTQVFMVGGDGMRGADIADSVRATPQVCAISSHGSHEAASSPRNRERPDFPGFRGLALVSRRWAPRLGLRRDEFVLVVVATRISRITDYANVQTAGLFGDMASATLLAGPSNRRHPMHFEILHADAEKQQAQKSAFDFHVRDHVPVPSPDGGTRHDDERLVYSLDGMAIAEIAPRAMSAAVAKALGESGLAGGDVNFVVPHQAGTGIVRFTGMQLEGLGIRGELVNGLTRRTGNVSACSVPHALKETWSRLTGLVACPTAAVGSPGRPEVLQGCVLLRSTALHDRQATVAA